MTLRVLIADDEAPARRKLKRFLAVHQDIAVVGEAVNGREAVDLATALRPDLAFIDIGMPELDGLAVAEFLTRANAGPAIIFVTAFDAYAVAAFDASALDYLLKPYDQARFERSLERAQRYMQKPAPDAAALIALLARSRRQLDYARRILVPNDGRSFFIAVEAIRWIEADGNSVIVHARNGAHRVRATLESIEARLDPQSFARVHRSHIVNIDEIVEIAAWFHGDYKIRLRDHTELAWSRRYVQRRPDLLK